MKYRLLVVVLMTMVFSVSWAQFVVRDAFVNNFVNSSEVSLLEARYKAMKCYEKVAPAKFARLIEPYRDADSDYKTFGQSEIDVVEIDGIDNLWILSLRGGNGFFVVPKYRCNYDVMAYSTTGTIDASIPEFVKVLYEEMDSYVGKYEGRVVKMSKAGDDYPYATVGPLIATEWSQRKPYNEQCPVYEGQRCVTGCVATAMAQVMRYWQYPEHGTASHSYEEARFGTLSVDFSSATYDWSLMPKRPTATSPAAVREQVSQLMYHCGVSVNMGYGTGTSGAATSYIPSALISYFGYDTTTREYDRQMYSDEDWHQMIVYEIREGRPVIYSGSSESGSGHSFIIDGYDSFDYYHVNWGWGGSYDGYYALDGFNPLGSGVGGNDNNDYNYYNSAIMGIQPAASVVRFTSPTTEFSRWGDTIVGWLYPSMISSEVLEISTDAEWLSVSADIDTPSIRSVYLTAPRNTTGTTRTATLHIATTRGDISVVFSQEDASTSSTGCYGNLNEEYNAFSVIQPGEMFIARAEAMGNFVTGQQIESVGFSTASYGTLDGRDFDIIIYENPDFTTDLQTTSMETRPMEHIGTVAYRQRVHVDEHGVNSFELDEPYQITSGTDFWVALRAVDTSLIMVDHHSMHDSIDGSQYPVIDSIETDFIMYRAATSGDSALVLAFSYTSLSGINALQYSLLPRLKFCIGEAEIECEDVEVENVHEYCTSYFWADDEFTEAQTFTTTLEGVVEGGCDSIVYDVFSQRAAIIVQHLETSCDTLLPFAWRDTLLSDADTYLFVYEGEDGCDTNFYLQFMVDTCVAGGEDDCVTMVFETNETVCDTLLPFIWHDTSIMDAGTYDFVYYGDDACDTIERLSIVIDSCSQSEQGCSDYVQHLNFDTTCSSIEWRGHVFDEDGQELRHEGVVEGGCDSVFIVHIVVNPSNRHEQDTIVLSSELPLAWEDTILVTSGTYKRVYPAADGCDSTLILNLNIEADTSIVVPTCQDVYDTTVARACDSYEWRGLTYTFTINETVVDEDVIDGECDSVHLLILEIGHAVNDTVALSICNTSWTFEGETYNSDTVVFNNTFVSSFGCDSVSYYDLSFVDTYIITLDTIVACDRYSSEDSTYYVSTDYRDRYTTAYGCDSTVSRHLVIYYSDSSSFDTLACDTLTFNGITYASDTSFYLLATTNSYGCDSLERVNIYVGVGPQRDTLISVCDSMRWVDGTLLTTTDSYRLHLTSDEGCDTLVNLELQVRRSTSAVFDVEACGSYRWHDSLYTMTDTIVYATGELNIAGCDSSDVLQLTIGNNSEHWEEVLVCDSLLWNNILLYTDDSTVRAMLRSREGCDSLVVAHTTLRHVTRSVEYAEACGTYTWHGNRLDYDGIAYDTLVNAQGCDSIIRLDLTLHPSTQGGLNGIFEVADGRRVIFSSGNLQYMPVAGVWRFANQQFDIVGYDNNAIAPNYMGWIDLFGWATSGYHSGSDSHNRYYMPYSTASCNVSIENSHGYGPSITMQYPDLDGYSIAYDWGVYNAISNGGNVAGRWHTLTADEWQHLLFDRADAANKRAMANVSNINGLVLLPDSWSLPLGMSFTAGSNEGYMTNSYSSADWAVMESAGALFLPAAGMRYDTTTSTVVSNGFYWSATHSSQSSAYAVSFDRSRLEVASLDRSVGRSVRLVQELSDEGAPCATYGDTVIVAYEPLTWLGTQYDTTGDYQRTLTGANTQGCDSIVIVHFVLSSPDGIDDIDAVKPHIWSYGQTLCISNVAGRSLDIYDLNGRSVLSQHIITTNDLRLPLPLTGVYMVRIGGSKPVKVVLR